ncbi:MAG: response regulator [Thermodesulfobacteriota bacterium]
MRVLLVDDEQELVATLAERLAFRGIDAEWATSGQKALQRLADESFDIAVIDVKMPVMNGFELKHKMQVLRPELKYIFLTGHGSQQDYLTGQSEAGMDFYLIKPVDIDILIQKMRETLNK